MLEKLPPVVGHALRHRRAGLDETLFSRADLRQGMAVIQVASLAFVDHARIPARYTADGEGHSPPLQWIGVPEAAAEVLLLVEDADAPTPHPLVHAVVSGLPGEDGALAEGAISRAGEATTDADVGRNSFLGTGWLPPDPPPGHGAHRYVFQVFALAPGDALPSRPGRDDVERAVRERGIASGQLIGTYERPDGSIRVDQPAAVPAAQEQGPLAS